MVKDYNTTLPENSFTLEHRRFARGDVLRGGVAPGAPALRPGDGGIRVGYAL